MKKVLITIRQHPVSITAYLIYLILWIRTLTTQYYFHKQTHRSVATGGEVVAYITMLCNIIGLIFFLWMFFEYVYRSNEDKFYGMMILLTMIQTIILWQE